MKKRISAILLIAFLLLPVLPLRVFASGKYVASRNSDVYHYSYCSYVSSIYESNKIWFDTAAEAEATGRRGCSRCKPFASTESPGTQASKSQTKNYSKSDLDDAYDEGYDKGYNFGRSSGYRFGREEGFDSGYEKARYDLESEYRKKVEEAASEASEQAYWVSGIVGIPAALLFCSARLSKQERDLRKKYGITAQPKPQPQPARPANSVPKSQPPKAPAPPPAPKVPENPSVIGPNPASGIRDMRFSKDAFIITFGDGKQYLYYNVPHDLGEVFANANNCLQFFFDRIDGIYPYMLVPD